ncbi:MAG: PAS domain S-box protein [Acidimicrobiales bacterium]
MGDRRLLAGVITLLVTLGLLSVVSAIFTSSRIEDQLTSAEEFHLDALSAAQSLNTSVNETAQETYAFVIAGDAVERESARRSIAEFDELMATFEDVESHRNEQQVSALVSSIVERHATFALENENIFAAYRRDGEIGAAGFERYESLIELLTADIASLVDIEREEVQENQALALRIEQRARDGIAQQGVLFAVLSVVGVAVTVWLFRRLSDSRDAAHRRLSIHQQALDATSIAVVVADTGRSDHPIVYVNRAFEEMTGFSSEEALGRNLTMLRSPKTDMDAVHEIIRAIDAEESTSVLIENLRADGSLLWGALHISPIFDESGTATHYVEVIEDVTERVRLERRVLQAGKMDAVGQLAGGIAHDFNNYLMIINGATEMIRSGNGADPSYWLDRIEAAGERSSALTSQLMTFARAQLLTVETVDLNEVVSEVTSLLGTTIGENISIIVDLVGESCPVSADRSQLDQVVTNIVINARDAMPDGGMISIATALVHLGSADLAGDRRAAEGPYVRLSISDSGPGIDAEVLGDIFEPFTTTKEPGRGAGLGLATVYGIVTQAGGLITVETEPDMGATFGIHLPLAAEPAHSVATPRPAETTEEFSGTALLVEDDPSVREAVRAMLESLGFFVLEAGDGLEAIDALAANPEIRLAVSDVTMPHMGGIELARRACSDDPDLTVLLMSGYTQDEASFRAWSGPRLAKPFTLAELRTALTGLFADVGVSPHAGSG